MCEMDASEAMSVDKKDLCGVQSSLLIPGKKWRNC